MAKVPARRIPSDDFVVIEDGEYYHPHEGEWIEVVGKLKVGELRAFDQIKVIGVQVESLQGDTDAAAQLELIDAMSQHFQLLCAGMADRIVNWSWTDDHGRPLPNPLGRPDVLEQLTTEEVYYLYGAIQAGVSVSDRGKDTPPSQITSLATAPVPIQTPSDTPINRMSGF